MSTQSAEHQAFLQLLKAKPPAKTDGLFGLVSELKNDQYTNDEQQIMAADAAGQRLARSLSKCEGLKQKAREYGGDDDKSKQVRKEAAYKYVDCLSYMSCPVRWKEYTSCWTNLSKLGSAQLNDLRSKGGLEVVCQKERHALERCVGHLVAETVRAADATYADFIDT